MALILPGTAQVHKGGGVKLGALDLPVGHLSWCGANAYVDWLNARYPEPEKIWRLPTEAEWEYAARGETSSAYWWGAIYEAGYANCSGDGVEREGLWRITRSGENDTTAPFGLRNMLGNVMEWVEDAYAPFSPVQQTDPVVLTTEKPTGRVMRGGSWTGYPGNCRVAGRWGYSPENKKGIYGLRVCLGFPIEPWDARRAGR